MHFIEHWDFLILKLVLIFFLIFQEYSKKEFMTFEQSLKFSEE